MRTQGGAGSSYYSGWKVSTNTLRRNTALTLPTSFTASPSSYHTENVTLSWSGAAAGTSAISKYSIYYQTSTDGSKWSGWYSLTTISSSATSGSTSVSPPSTRGYYRRYQIRTQGGAGSSYYSGFRVSSNSLRRNTAPTAPSSFSASPSSYSSENITLSWSGARPEPVVVKFRAAHDKTTAMQVDKKRFNLPRVRSHILMLNLRIWGSTFSVSAMRHG